MTGKLLGIFTSITAALLVVSVAWAAGGDDRQDDDSEARLAMAGEAAVAASAESSSSVTGVTLPSTSSTSVTSAGSSSTSVTSAGSTSTSVTIGEGSSTSTTTRTEFTSSVGGTFRVSDAGTVTVAVRAGMLVLLDVTAPGWEIRIKDVEHDRVRVEFRKGEAKAEFRAELESGLLEIEIRRS